MSKDEECVIRVAILGDSGVGKTSLVSHLIQDHADRGGLYSPTVGCDVQVVALASRDNSEDTYFVELWDIGGNPHYEAARSNLYQECDGFIYVYDADNLRTFHSLELWLSEVLRNKGPALAEYLERNGHSMELIDELGGGRLSEEECLEESEDTPVEVQTSEASKETRRNTYYSSRRTSHSRSRRAGGGNYSSGNLHMPVGTSVSTSGRVGSFLFGTGETGNVVDGDSSISHSVINRRHNQKRQTDIHNPAHSVASTTSRRATRLPHDVNPPLTPLQPRSPKGGNRQRIDSLVSQYNIQSPSANSDMSEGWHESRGKKGREEAELSEDTVAAPGGGSEISLAALEEGAIEAAGAGLNRRKPHGQGAVLRVENSPGAFPHGGLPLMIVANKVDKLNPRDLKALRTECDNHVFTVAKFEAPLNERPFVDFFHEIRRAYSRL